MAAGDYVWALKGICFGSFCDYVEALSNELRFGSKRIPGTSELGSRNRKSMAMAVLDRCLPAGGGVVKGENMRLQGKRVAVLVENLYEDLEGWYPILRLKEEGAEVVVVGPERDRIYHGKHGYPLRSEASSREVAGDSFDAVVVPGGYAPDMMRREKSMVAFVASAFHKDKIVAGICHAGWMLISAGAVRGKTVTGFFAIKDDLVNAGANFVDREVVVDGKLVTSRNPGDLPAFLRAIIELLEG